MGESRQIEGLERRTDADEAARRATRRAVLPARATAHADAYSILGGNAERGALRV